jgi:hypothetical protein
MAIELSEHVARFGAEKVAEVLRVAVTDLAPMLEGRVAPAGAGTGAGAVSLGQPRVHETVHAMTIQSSSKSAIANCAACSNGSTNCSSIAVSICIVASLTGDGTIPA